MRPDSVRLVDEPRTVSQLVELLAICAQHDDGEGISILEQGLQCAYLLAQSHPSDVELQVAGLVHDVGWLEPGVDGWELRADAAHDVVGGRRVEPVLGGHVARLVAGHVAAKRYLVTTDPMYREGLSARSVKTLLVQGDAMDAAEVAAFEVDPDHDDILALRRADEAAKEADAVVADLGAWAEVLDHVARS